MLCNSPFSFKYTILERLSSFAFPLPHPFSPPGPQTTDDIVSSAECSSDDEDLEECDSGHAGGMGVLSVCLLRSGLFDLELFPFFSSLFMFIYLFLFATEDLLLKASCPMRT